MNDHSMSKLKVFVVLVVILIINGCATTKGTYNVVTPPKDDSQLLKYSDLNVDVQYKEGVPMTSNDRERILFLVLKHVRSSCAGRYKSINSSTADNRTLNVFVVINNYDEGNAFARFMLAGLGQMHIDAEVTLMDSLKKEKIAVYEVNKTFAWGGTYGASARITDIEDGFAQAVAETITGINKTK